MAIWAEAIAEKVADSLRSSPASEEPFLHRLAVSRHLERVAELASNIAEDATCMAGAASSATR